MFVPAKGVILVKINFIGLSGHARDIFSKNDFMPKRLIFLLIDRPPSVGFVQFPTEGGLSQSKKISLFGIKSFWLKIST